MSRPASRRAWLQGLGLGLGAAWAVPAAAQGPPGAGVGAGVGAAWPARGLRIVVPYPAGGASDVAARLLAPELQRALGQPVQVDNRAGANGNIGSAEVAGASDGHTLLMGSVGTHVLNPLLSARLPYDPVKDFAPVCLVGTVPLVLVMNPASAQNLGVRTVADLVHAATSQPGRLNLASGGNGSPTHLAGELFRRLTQVSMLHFPYRSAVSALDDVLAGTMDLMFEALPAVLPHLRAGRLLPLGVTSLRRSAILPELPTVHEAGGPALRGYEASSWVGLFAPVGQPADQLARLQRECGAALASPALRERLTQRGLLVQGTTAAALSDRVAAETAKWARVVQLSGVKVDR